MWDLVLKNVRSQKRTCPKSLHRQFFSEPSCLCLLRTLGKATWKATWWAPKCSPKPSGWMQSSPPGWRPILHHKKKHSFLGAPKIRTLLGPWTLAVASWGGNLAFQNIYPTSFPNAPEVRLASKRYIICFRYPMTHSLLRLGGFNPVFTALDFIKLDQIQSFTTYNKVQRVILQTSHFAVPLFYPSVFIPITIFIVLFHLLFPFPSSVI